MNMIQFKVIIVGRGSFQSFGYPMANMAHKVNENEEIDQISYKITLNILNSFKNIRSIVANFAIKIIPA